MIINNRTFRGGYTFAKFKGEPDIKLVKIGPPGKACVPLKQGFGEEVQPEVRVGDTVSAGQIIGRNDGNLSNPVHSPVSGTVKSFAPIVHFGKKTGAILIESSGENSGDVWKALPGFSAEWQNLDRSVLEDLVYLSGASGLDSGGIPTRYLSSPINSEDVEDIIIHNTEADLFSPLTEVLLQGGGAEEFAAGCLILDKLFPKAGKHIVVSGNNRKILEKLDGLFKGHDSFSFYTVKPKYPADMEEVLVPAILRKPYPFGFRAVNIGVVVLSFQTVLHVFQAVAQGKPVIDRVVSLGGERFSENLHALVRIGTSVEELVKDRVKKGETRYIFNSLNTGVKIKDLSEPVDRNVTSVIAIPEAKEGEAMSFAKPGFIKDSYSNTVASVIPLFKKESNTNIHGEKRACISCGFCQDVCPVGIMPNLLHKYVDRNIIEETLVNYKIFNCIDCNLCTYVCTSKIGVASLIAQGKEKLRADGVDNGEFVRKNFALKGIQE